METIKNYLDNMFAGLPRNEEMQRLKAEIYDSMYEKYQELKENGKSENEAIGIVISEFGNIDELLEEFNISRDESQEHAAQSNEKLPEVTLDDAYEYLRFRKRSGVMIGTGVFLCIFGVLLLIAVSSTIELAKGHMAWDWGEGSDVIGVILMLVCIAVAVGLFIYAGIMESSYDYIKHPFYTSAYVKSQIEGERKLFQPAFAVAMIIGVILCVLSPVPIFISSMVGSDETIAGSIGVCVLLFMVSCAVFIFIYFGMISDTYKQLLQIEEYAPKHKKAEKIIGAVASVIWPLVTIVFLYLGFARGMWHPGWIIYPITGITFGIFSSIVNTVVGKE